MLLFPCLTSCKDYLDKDPESIIGEDDAFKSFQNFQGFVERVTHAIPDVAKSNWATSFNWGLFWHWFIQTTFLRHTYSWKSIRFPPAD